MPKSSAEVFSLPFFSFTLPVHGRAEFSTEMASRLEPALLSLLLQGEEWTDAGLGYSALRCDRMLFWCFAPMSCPWSDWRAHRNGTPYPLHENVLRHKEYCTLAANVSLQHKQYCAPAAAFHTQSSSVFLLSLYSPRAQRCGSKRRAAVRLCCECWTASLRPGFQMALASGNRTPRP